MESDFGLRRIVKINAKRMSSGSAGIYEQMIDIEN